MKIGASGRAALTLVTTLIAGALLAATPAVSDPISRRSASAEPFVIAQTEAATPAGAAADQPNQPIAADSNVLEADQLNALDMAASQATERVAAPETAKEQSAPAAPKADIAAAKGGSTWDQTSVIGKVFIAFGGLLTLASAARMLMG